MRLADPAGAAASFKESVKRAILKQVAQSGSGMITKPLSDDCWRALAEMVVTGLVYDDETFDGQLLIVVTKQGLEEAARL